MIILECSFLQIKVLVTHVESPCEFYGQLLTTEDLDRLNLISAFCFEFPATSAPCSDSNVVSNSIEAFMFVVFSNSIEPFVLSLFGKLVLIFVCIYFSFNRISYLAMAN